MLKTSTGADPGFLISGGADLSISSYQHPGSLVDFWGESKKW